MSSETKPQPEAGAQRESDIYDLLAWLEVNKKKVAIAAVVLVGIGFSIATIRYMGQQKEINASAALLALKPTLTPQTNVPPAQPADLLKVAREYSGTSAAERARVLAAAAYFTDGKYAEAETEFTQFVKDHPESPWVAEAAYGIAAAQEALNKTNEAQASYQNVATAYMNSSVADDAKLALARIYEEEKKPEQALRLYNELLAPRPGGQPGEMGNPSAFQRKEALLRSHPELNTNLLARPLPALAPAMSLGTNQTAADSSNAAPALAVTNTAASAEPAAVESTNAPAAK